MSSSVISLKNVSKEYKLYSSPAHRVKEAFHPLRKKYNTTFHALKDISFTVNRGETVGIMGRNGCGKSTLLQIVCGIMPPTSGDVHVHGRISAILELGSGFNPEFTGRSNVYLNCSILGMDRSEVDERIGAILEFADIGEYIDQPVKSYSSGMTVRLAFSIAINVDPQILVVDEALSVGDEAFQRKCFARIQTIKENGCTILFVSHSAGTVIELCDRAVLLDRGEMLFCGSPKKATTMYHELLFAPAAKVDGIREKIIESWTGNNVAGELPVKKKVATSKKNLVKKDKSAVNPLYNPNLLPQSTKWYASDGAIIKNPRILTLQGERVNILVRNEDYYFSYTVDLLQDAFEVRFCMLIKTVRGIELGGYGKRVEDESEKYIAAGTRVHVRLRFRCILLPGTYFLNAGVMGLVDQDDRFLHRGIDVAMFEVMQENNIGSTAIVDFGVRPFITLEEPQK